jgi:precorrin-6Y C5,15-methyltransferase (decarboxylating)
MTFSIHIFGMAGKDVHKEAVAPYVSSAAALVAGSSLYSVLLEVFPEEDLPPLIPVVPLKECFNAMHDALQQGDILVLASGDPLFFGVARRIIETFPDIHVSVRPSLSSMQLAFARFAIPWDDAEFITLHGRDISHLATKLLTHAKVCLLTDGKNSPRQIANRIIEECGGERVAAVSCYVAESLGTSDERLLWGSLAEMAEQQFRQPNVMILLNPHNKSTMPSSPRFGLKEEEIVHSRGLLTKNEVRAAAIHALRLHDDSVLWDVGAGSGSVGLEVARLFPSIHVLSVEKEEQQWQNILSNCERYSLFNMQLVKGQAPEVLLDLVRPHRIFVGGSGGNLKVILEHCSKVLLPGGIIVVNAVISTTAELAPEVLHNLSMSVEIREIKVKRRSYPHGDEQRFNPITIIVAEKKMKESAHEQ